MGTVYLRYFEKYRLQHSRTRDISVVPAQAGTYFSFVSFWIPAFAGMTFPNFCSVVPAQPVPGSSTGSGNLDFLCSKNSTRASPWPLQSFRVQSFMDARQPENRYRHSRSQDYASCGKSPGG